MVKFCRQNNEGVISKIYNNQIDGISMSNSNLVDDIILSMHKQGVLECLTNSFLDKRKHNTTIPFNLVLALSIAAKMKTKTSLSDIPYAIQDHRVLSKLGYNLLEKQKGAMSEGSIRFLMNKYSSKELINCYNNSVQKNIMKKLDIKPNIHILDCTELSVNIDNLNYEGSAICTNKYGHSDRGYKLSTLRGIVGDTGIIEEICFGGMNIHDLKLSQKMLRNTKVFKKGDILINDRGFLDRDLINFLKIKKEVDTFVPLRFNMTAYQMAVSIATSENNWSKHPTRQEQKICLVKNLGQFWDGKNSDLQDVDFNAVVVKDIENFHVFISTNTNLSAKQIIQTYELRPEVEEDYRQLKDFWKIEDFKSTKYNMITFHIIVTLFGYLFFQLFTLTPEGDKYAHKSLPIVIKNYQNKTMPYLVIYTQEEFAILNIFEFMEIYEQLDLQTKSRIQYLLC